MTANEFLSLNFVRPISRRRLRRRTEIDYEGERLSTACPIQWGDTKEAVKSGISAEVATLEQELYEARKKIAELDRALRETRALAQTDALTGVLNRRGLECAFSREIARASRASGVVSLAMIDMDNFKRINDRFGHVVGDEVLVNFAALTQMTLRQTDVISRVGGEEFVIVFPDTTKTEAVAILERLQKLLSFMDIDEHHQGVTFSAGVVEINGAGCLDTVIQAADTLAYKAKFSGKNRIY